MVNKNYGGGDISVSKEFDEGTDSDQLEPVISLPFTSNPTNEDASPLMENNQLDVDEKNTSSSSEEGDVDDDKEWSEYAGVINSIQEGLSTNIVEPRKRSYTFVNRTKSTTSSQSSMRKRWKDELVQYSDSELKEIQCCKKLHCFRESNITFLRSKMLLYSNFSAERRKYVLHSMMTSEGSFTFDGKRVCATFLKRAFHFSLHLQSVVRGTDGSRSNKSSHSSNDSLYNSGRSTGVQRESIMSFLERLAENTSEKMPDTGESHLPFFRKRDVYTEYIKEYYKLHESGRRHSSKYYFCWTWKHFCPKIKIRKLGRFTKCDECEASRAALENAVKHGLDTEPIRRRRKAHIEFVAKERLEYKKKRDRAIIDPTKYASIILDGADQSRFGLPHFTTSTKAERGHSIKIKLLGLLEHCRPNRLHLYTLTEEFETGANHIIESLYRFILVRANKSLLPPRLFVQVDNCTRENKNRYFMSFIESLVKWGIFDEVEVGFLPIGHTHEDIDQSFSRTSDRLRTNNAITLEDLQAEVRQTYNKFTSVTGMENVVNWSELCENEKYLYAIPAFSHFRYFRFSKSAVQSNSIERNDPFVVCMVKVNCNDQWKYLHNSSDKDKKAFLKVTPNLEKMPPMKLIPPKGTQAEKVTQRLESEECRINSVSKMLELYSLRDKVFTARTDQFHWDISTIDRLRDSRTKTSEGGREIIEEEITELDSVEIRNEQRDLSHRNRGSLSVSKSRRTEQSSTNTTDEIQPMQINQSSTSVL